MSFGKGKQLLHLALMAASRSQGVSLREIEAEFSVTYRTAQRMIEALQSVFPDLSAVEDADKRRRWTLRHETLRRITAVQTEEMAALDQAIELLATQGLNVEAERLHLLAEKVRAFLVPKDRQSSFETDYEALLEAQGFVARPGPKPIADAEAMKIVTEAIKACRVLQITYRSRNDNEPRRRQIAPYGILIGLRRYVVAQALDQPPDDRLRLYLFESIAAPLLTDLSFERPAGFNMQDFAKRAFGVFQRQEEYGEVIWKFAPEAADHARGFEFHPDQVLELQPDGALIVRFKAAGHLEMCWHLYAWGDKVEVLAPEALRLLCQDFRRADFPALP